MKKYLLLLFAALLSGCSFFKPTIEVELIPFMQKDKYGYFDLKGKIAINPQYAYASAFRDGIALVKTTGDEGKWGYIDEKGKYVINPTYKNATTFQEGLAWVVTENSAPNAIDQNGEIKFTIKDAEQVRSFSNGLAAYSKADSTNVVWGFVDKSGSQVINPQFKNAGDFSDNKCAVQNKDGKWGYIDDSGKIIINYQFDSAYEFSEGKAIVYLDKKAGVIDKDGKYIVNPQFQYAYVDKDMYLIVQDDKAGWCDKEGKFIINPQFDNASLFGDNDLTNVESSDKYGFIDKEGKFIINPQFDAATQFFNDLALVKTGDKFGLIDKKGKYVVNPQFEEIGSDFYGYLAGYSYKSSIQSDYLDTDKLLKIINVDAPEGLTFSDDFQTIMVKKNKTKSDFNAYETTHIILDKQAISNEASYSFAVMGNAKEFSSYDYDYHITNQKPTGFVYLINLTGRVEGKSESIQKAFEKKLTNYALVKKGYVDNLYTSVFKNGKNIVVISSKDSSNPIIYVLNKDYDLAYYLNKITDKVLTDTKEVYDETAVEAVDTAAAVADSSAAYYN